MDQQIDWLTKTVSTVIEVVEVPKEGVWRCGVCGGVVGVWRCGECVVCVEV